MSQSKRKTSATGGTGGKKSKNPTDVGTNRTGVATSPAEAKKTVAGALEGSPEPIDEPVEYAAEKLEYSANAEPFGSMPPPAKLKGAARSVADPNQLAVLVDKLAARLAFERGGVRLYEALLVKYDAAIPGDDGPSRDELEEIRDDELRHFGMLMKALLDLGADPTAVTPSANLVGILSMGLVQSLNDPRTTLTQGLEAIQVAELADNDGWDQLIEIADGFGLDHLVAELSDARDEERDHLVKVRTWLSNAIRAQAGLPTGVTSAAEASSPLHP